MSYSAPTDNARGLVELISGVAFLFLYVKQKIARRRELKTVAEAASEGHLPVAQFDAQPALLEKKKDTFEKRAPLIASAWLLVPLILSFCNPIACIVVSAAVAWAFHLKNRNYKRGIAVAELEKMAPAQLTVKVDGLHFSPVFVEPYNYAALLKGEMRSCFVPWGDIKHLAQSTPEAGSYIFAPNPQQRRNFAGAQYSDILRNECLVLKFAGSSDSRRVWGKTFYLSYYLIGPQAELTFWLRKYLGKRCKL